jgi:RimJ/RimL family protein N-acetyltransferase
MVYKGVIEGRYVALRSATVEDAEFTLAVRQNPEFNKYLPRITNTLEQQKAWIQKQRNKDDDYFFVVWDKQCNRIGTISIYNIEGDHAEAGRLTMRGNAFQSIEAQLLSFRFGFNDLNLKTIVSYIYVENAGALRFTQQFGGVLHCPEEKDGRMEFKATNSKEDFDDCEKKLNALIYREFRKKEYKN